MLVCFNWKHLYILPIYSCELVAMVIFWHVLDFEVFTDKITNRNASNTFSTTYFTINMSTTSEIVRSAVSWLFKTCVAMQPITHAITKTYRKHLIRHKVLSDQDRSVWKYDFDDITKPFTLKLAVVI